MPYDPATQALVDARRRNAPKHNNAANAPAFQPANPNDPYYQRSDIAPLLRATNRDVNPGDYGIHGFLNNHPLGVIAALGGLAVGGAALSGGIGGAGAGSSGFAAGGTPASVTAAGAGGANTTAGGLGIFGNGGAAGLAGVGGGNAGALAASGGIAGGAGIGGTSAGALGGLSGGLGRVANMLGGTMGGSSGSGGLWGNLLQLGGSLYNTNQQRQGAKAAANAAAAGDAAGIAEERRQFDLSRSDQAPWLAAGGAALNRLQDPNAFTQSPGYAFVKNEALNGVQNSAAAQGGLYSGNAARALQDRAAGLASTDYNNWFNQQSSLAGLGQSSAQSLGSLGQNSANNVANLLGNQANARASGIVDQTNATTNGINDIANWYGNWMRNRAYSGGG